MSTSEEQENKLIELYGQAEEMMGANADALRGMALLAHANRSDREALKVLTQCWGRNSRHMVRAVKRHPDMFTGETSQLDAGGYLSLFSLGRLPKEAEEELFLRWRDASLTGWQMRDLVQDWFEKRKSQKRQRVVLKGCRVWQIELAAVGERDRLVLELPTDYMLAPTDWIDKRATVTLSLEKVKEEGG